MPYQSIEELPDSVRHVLPEHAQQIYKEAFNHAYQEYADRGPKEREETAHRVAWAAVKKKYRKDETTGRWVEAR
jgi:cation transport regulator